MKKTLVLTIDKEMEHYIYQQPGLVDPSDFINNLFHQEMKRQGMTIQKKSNDRLQNDAVQDESELFIDQDTPAAG